MADPHILVTADWLRGGYGIVYRDHLTSPEVLGLPAAALKTWLLLVTYADPRGADARPGVERMAHELRTTDRTITRSTNALEDAGLLRKEAHPTDPRRLVYRLLTPPSLRTTDGAVG